MPHQVHVLCNLFLWELFEFTEESIAFGVCFHTVIVVVIVVLHICLQIAVAILEDLS